MDDMTSPDLTALTADIVSAFVTNNSVTPADLPALIQSVHQALSKVGQPTAAEPEKPQPAVSIKKSVTPDYIVDLFTGQKFKSLKRPIRTRHNMTPEQYKAYWGLPADYPFVAPNYAAARSELAKTIGLGQRRWKAAPTKVAAKGARTVSRKGGKAA
jgi:predicted transcriptional regulator